MRARCRSLVAGAALAGASAVVWAPAAGAGESYDEFNHIEPTVHVNGVDCKLLITSYRQGSTVRATTYQSTPDNACFTIRVTAELQFRTAHGDVVTTNSADDGPGAAVGASGAVDLVRSTHSVTWSTGDTSSYTLNSK